MSKQTEELLREEALPLTEEQEEAALPEGGGAEEYSEDASEAYEEEEAYEDEDGEEDEAVHAATYIDGPILDAMAKVMVEQTPQKTRVTYLVLGLVALPAAIVCVAAGQAIIGCLLAVLAFFLLQSWYASNEKTARKRLSKSEGLCWDYTVDKLGVHVGKTVHDQCIGWNLVKRAWLEGDLYLLEVRGSLVVIRRSTLTNRERNTLELLLLEHVDHCTL